MATRIRTEVSKKKEYWLPKHRQLELVHFCLQYPEWKVRLKELDGYSSKSHSIFSIGEDNGTVSNPVEKIIEERIRLEVMINMVNQAVSEVGDDLGVYLLKGVTESISYEALHAPCCREVYYKTYRRFFWTLDKIRR